MVGIRGPLFREGEEMNHPGIRKERGRGTGGAKQQQQQHTIILIQISNDRQSRDFQDFNSVEDAIDGILNIYEENAKALNPNLPRITYTIDDLYSFIDDLVEVACLVYTDSIKAYAPHGKKWLKTKILSFMEKQAGKR